MKASFSVIALALGIGALASPVPAAEPQGYGNYGNYGKYGKYGSYGTYPKLATREAAAAPAPGYGNYGNMGNTGHVSWMPMDPLRGAFQAWMLIACGTDRNYPKNAVREAAPNPEAEADADLAALEDLVSAIKSKRANYGNYGNYGAYGKYGRQVIPRPSRIYGSYPREAEPEAAPEAAPEAVPAPAE
nr:hypothetical protein B0A51_07261 [Rachicladosporium sp. CCFEE 5018]